MNLRNLYAKSYENGFTTVIDHSIATKNLALRCFDRFISKISLWYDYSNDNLRKSLGRLSIFHDLLKVSKLFQKSLTKNTNDDDSDNLSLTHDIMTWAFLENNSDLDKDELRTILYHHVIDADCDLSADDICYEIKKSGDYDVAKEMFLFFKDELKKDGIDVNLTDYKEQGTRISSVSMYPKIRGSEISDIDRLIKCHLLRSILIFSDRMVSKMYENIDEFVSNNVDFMDSVIDNTIYSEINGFFKHTDFYSIEGIDKERLSIQESLVGDLLRRNNSILMASTGFGKTFVGLKWWCQGNKKLFWVTPTTSIAENSFREIKKIITKANLQDKISIALLISGEYREGDENSNIIVSVIDGFLGKNIKNRSAHCLLNTLTCDVVFDEFQDYTNANPMFSSFISMCGARLRFTDSRTLLLSATPPMYHNRFWGNDNIQFIKFGVYDKNKKIKINLKKINDVADIELSEDSITIFNTIPNSQNFCKKYGQYDKTILLHTLFPLRDKEHLLDEVLKNRSKNSNKNERKTIFGTNVIGVGCDISASEINDIIISPDNTIQRCGRGDRFGEKGEMELNCFIINNKSANTFIKNYYGNKYGVKIYSAWCDYLTKLDGKVLTNEEFYEHYLFFCSENKKLFKEYWEKLFVDSSSSYSELKPYRSSTKNNSKVISSRPNFRGTSDDIYVKARKLDGTLSDTMQIPLFKLGDSEKTTEAVKTHINFFKSIIPKNIYLYKYGMRNYTDEANINNWARIAKHEETPLLLHSAVLDDKLGLVF